MMKRIFTKSIYLIFVVLFALFGVASSATAGDLAGYTNTKAVYAVSVAPSKAAVPASHRCNDSPGAAISLACNTQSTVNRNFAAIVNPKPLFANLRIPGTRLDSPPLTAIYSLPLPDTWRQ